MLSWYDRAGRPLPWRERPSVYGTWISEIMLQQTTVAAVVPRWHEFLRCFPDVGSLAAAEEAEVLNAWSGLGYYRRARQLHAAAKTIVITLDGRLPVDEAGWSALPGIGAYTAGAIASIGLGETVPAVDTNVVRVLSRLVCHTANEAASLTSASVRILATALVDLQRPGDWNQALMDLGAGVCTTAVPECSACPLAGQCRAEAGGEPETIPPARSRPRPIKGHWSLLVARAPGGLLVALPQAPPALLENTGEELRHDYGSLYRGYRSLPFGAWSAEPGDAVDNWTQWWLRLGGAWSEPPRDAGMFRHAITRYRLQARVVAGSVCGWPGGAVPEGVVVVSEAELKDLPLNTPSLRAFELAIGNQDPNQ